MLENLQNSGKKVDLNLLNKIKDQNIVFLMIYKIYKSKLIKSKQRYFKSKTKDIENSLKLFSDLNEIKKVACK